MSVFLIVLLLLASVTVSASKPETAQIHSSPSATIPAFPEQSSLSSACPLLLPPAIFPALRSSCSRPLRRSQCCPSLAAWLYSAYAPAALSAPLFSSAYDLPVPPDDSETCVASLEKAMDEKGVQLARPNDTCDLVYCYCGIRLHPLRCPGEVSEAVGRLERECRGVDGCNKCLHTLNQLKGNNYERWNKSEERLKKMQNKDCELMGLTWLLSKNRTAYIRTVTSVLRALMMNTDDHDGPHSCKVDSDELPLAVDSSEIDGQSSSTALHFQIALGVVSLFVVVLELLYSSI